MVELTEREREVIKLAAFEGLNEQGIADAMCLALSTIRTHINNVRNKLGSPSMRRYWVVDGLKYLLQNGLITVEEFTKTK